jgi:hypothetical protein
MAAVNAAMATAYTSGPYNPEAMAIVRARVEHEARLMVARERDEAREQARQLAERLEAALNHIYHEPGCDCQWAQKAESLISQYAEGASVRLWVS